jgi:hypothetical protein
MSGSAADLPRGGHRWCPPLHKKGWMPLPGHPACLNFQVQRSVADSDPCYLLSGLGAGGFSGRGAETPVVVGEFSGIHIIVVRSYL